MNQFIVFLSLTIAIIISGCNSQDTPSQQSLANPEFERGYNTGVTRYDSNPPNEEDIIRFQNVEMPVKVGMRTGALNALTMVCEKESYEAATQNNEYANGFQKGCAEAIQKYDKKYFSY